MVRSERLFVSGDSWFSVKAMQVAYFLNKKNYTGIALINVGERLIGFFEISKTLNSIYLINCKQTQSEKVLSQKGKSPDHKLKSQKKNLV